MRGMCEGIRERLPVYVDEALDAAEAELVREHLAGCAACRSEAERWARLNGLLTTHLQGAEPVDEAEVEALLARVRRERPEWRLAPESALLRRSWTPAAALAVAAVLLALLGGYPPDLNLGAARETLLDQAAGVASSSRELTRVDQDAAALYADAVTWPREAADGARRQWGESLGWAESLTRRVGVAPLGVCLLILAAANVAVARGVRIRPRRAQGG